MTWELFIQENVRKILFGSCPYWGTVFLGTFHRRNVFGGLFIKEKSFGYCPWRKYRRTVIFFFRCLWRAYTVFLSTGKLTTFVKINDKFYWQLLYFFEKVMKKFIFSKTPRPPLSPLLIVVPILRKLSLSLLAMNVASHPAIKVMQVSQFFMTDCLKN